jgi:hypothetical protein
MFAYPFSSISFIQTHFRWPYQVRGDTKINKNIIQDLPPNWKANMCGFTGSAPIVMSRDKWRYIKQLPLLSDWSN